MPKPHFPPTPASSSNLEAFESHTTIDTLFSLPPAMISAVLESPSAEINFEPVATVTKSSALSHHPSPPVSPVSKPLISNAQHKRTTSRTVKSRNASGGSFGSSKAERSPSPFSPPPPPQRARKIIQMTPKLEPQNTALGSSSSTTTPAGAKGSGKRKQNNSGTTASSRRVARKTAHSIIERRRRSKMNEEFGVLKDMIPACDGHEMHKLAILQAGIEYVRYLEAVIGDLKKDKPSSKGRGKRSREDEDASHTPSTRPPSGSKVQPQESKPIKATPQASPAFMPLSSSPTSKPPPKNNDSVPSPSDSITAAAPDFGSGTTYLSPAFDALQFSQHYCPTTTDRHHPSKTSNTASPSILPMPPAMMDVDNNTGIDDTNTHIKSSHPDDSSNNGIRGDVRSTPDQEGPRQRHS